MADIDDLLARYSRPADSPQSDLADITSRYSGSGWDRDMVLPFAREVGGQQASADPQAWRNSSDIMRHIDQREGKQWKLASPQIAYDALEAALNVGTAPLAGAYRMDDDTRSRMIDMAGAIVGPQAGVGMARAAMGTGAELGSHGGRLPASQPARSIDPLGYYSQAYEAAKALPQAKGTPEQMLAMLRKGGAKDAELTAARINDILEGKPSVTRDEILKHLEGNRVGLNEVEYRTPSKNDTLALADSFDKEAWRRGVDPAVKEELLDLVSATRRGDITAADFQGGASHAGLMPETIEAVNRVLRENGVAKDPSKWANYSLDPTNPTYRETVLHLPESVDKLREKRMAELNRIVEKYGHLSDAPPAERAAFEALDKAHYNQRPDRVDFQSGHFPEPNIIGHMMTSTTSHQGKPVYTVDQIQSDWGQRLRDKGARDEGKIADIKFRIDQMNQKWMADADLEALAPQAMELANAAYPTGYLTNNQKYGNEWHAVQQMRADGAVPAELRERASDLWMRRHAANSQYEPTLNMLRAELQTAEAATPGHPLANSTDQWTNTTLRRALTQAANSDARYLAIPTGDTVLSYNPGDMHGMNQFYGRPARHALNISDNLESLPSPVVEGPIEGIVPKNLRKILQKLDKEYPAPQYVPTLDSPSGKTGLGKGFSLFPLPEHIKDKIKSEGLPLFARGIGPQPLRPYEDE